MQQLNPSKLATLSRSGLPIRRCFGSSQRGHHCQRFRRYCSNSRSGRCSKRRNDRFPGNLFGFALNLERDSVGAVVLGDYKGLREGQTARCTGRILEVPTGPELLGRVVDALGNPIDGKGPVNASASSPVEKVAPGVIARQHVDQPVQTGLKCIDSMIPVGRGQRELIIGDRQTGKTAIAIDTIINQQASGIKCVYVAIGQKFSSIANVVRTLEELARWKTPLLSPLVPPTQHPCNTSPLTQGVQWANTLGIEAKMR